MHQGLAWRIRVESHNIAYLLDKQGIGRQFEGFCAMRLQAERPSDALHGTATHPAPLRHRARTPVYGVGGRCLQSLSDNLFHRCIHHCAGCPGARFIQQPIEAMGHKVLPLLQSVCCATRMARAPRFVSPSAYEAGRRAAVSARIDARDFELALRGLLGEGGALVPRLAPAA